MNKRKRDYQRKFDPRDINFCGWFIGSIIASISIHLFLFDRIKNLEIGTFNPSTFDSIVPRRFHLESVKIDPVILEEFKDKKTNIIQHEVDLGIQKTESFSLESPLQNNNPKPSLIDNNDFLEDKPEVLSENIILPEGRPRDNQPLLAFDSTTKESTLEDIGLDKQKSVATYSRLDQLIEEKTVLSSQTAPILLPTDLLFEYNADQLKKEAENSLKKLALLIQRNPKAQFIVEGFTDNFGSDEFNMNLSTRRANTIKEWLIKKELINPNQIQAYGLGKTHFLVPSTGSIEQQSLNRRVEIIIHQNNNP
ncbi:MAG: OmpA family protein [Verrucomicrobiae bacterium]|jgi:outer membrane protein OmpA-like peptidoglycan-associated protein|nr:OmpA family protein [Verrucomicrobiae bacterium]